MLWAHTASSLYCHLSTHAVPLHRPSCMPCTLVRRSAPPKVHRCATANTHLTHPVVGGDPPIALRHDPTMPKRETDIDNIPGSPTQRRANKNAAGWGAAPHCMHAFAWPRRLFIDPSAPQRRT